MHINKTKLKANYQTIAYQGGVSLIELMVAITIGLIITAALGALFLGISRTNEEMAKANSQIENGRFAMQLLQADIVHAGFWGDYSPQFDNLTYSDTPTDVPAAVPNPCLEYTAPWTAAHVTNLIGIPIQTYSVTPPSGAGCVTDLATNKKASTDVLVIRHAETCVPGEINCEADIADKLYFQASQCELENANPYILATSAFTLHKRDCVGTGAPQALPITAGTIAEKRKFVSNIYYIRDYASTVGDNIPTLMISQFDLAGGGLAHQTSVPLIEGIEGFSVELGIDNLSDTGAAVNYTQAVNWTDPTNLNSPNNRGDGVPDTFVRCTDAVPCTPAQLMNVVAVKVYVLARADKVSPGYTDSKRYALGSTTLGPFNDRFKRHVFSTTVRVNNVSSRRETP
ncbi:MAG: PilW family protein [Pseudomonadota bacterium]